MTEENKELLLKYLCMASPYNVYIMGDMYKTFDGGIISTLKSVDVERELVELKSVITPFHIDEVKPYLRLMSSITEDEKREIYNWLAENDVDWSDFSKLRLDKILISFDSSWLLVNWLFEHHFDFMGLISKSLAIKVTNKNNPYKE
jgi:hypothetical protein